MATAICDIASSELHWTAKKVQKVTTKLEGSPIQFTAQRVSSIGSPSLAPCWSLHMDTIYTRCGFKSTSTFFYFNQNNPFPIDTMRYSRLVISSPKPTPTFSQRTRNNTVIALNKRSTNPQHRTQVFNFYLLTVVSLTNDHLAIVCMKMLRHNNTSIHFVPSSREAQ